MGDFVAWLRAQLDEDERIAANCPSPDWELGCVYGSVVAAIGGRIALEAPQQSIADHIAEHDPARVLAEVAAKRAILAMHVHQRFPQPLDAESKFEEDRRPAFAEDPRYVGCVRCHFDWRYEEVYPSWWCDTVRWLASPYADRPGYDETWRP